jgi:hypothetical protein
LEVFGDLLRRLARWRARRSAGEAAVAAVLRLIGAAFFARVTMASMVVGGRRGVLTFRRRRRLIVLRRNERSDSLLSPRSVLWLRCDTSIVGARGRLAAGGCWMWFECI